MKIITFLHIHISCRSICSVILFFAFSWGTIAQTTVWEDNFNSYDNRDDSGTGTGFSPVDWSSGNDVEIRNDKIETRDENEDGYWRTDPINITGFTNLDLSFDTSNDNLRNSDRFSVRYRLDGGSWVTLVPRIRYPNSNYSFPIPPASTLQIEMLFDTNDEDSRYRLDNIELQGELPPCSNQLDYEFYDLVPSGYTVTNIPTTGAMGTGQINTFNVDNLQNMVDPGDTDSFAIRYTGYVHIPTSGSYTFYTNSDDGSNLYIDGAKIVDNDGDHGMQERSGTVTLSQGFHTIEVLFYENGGDEELQVSVAGPGISKMALPFSNLYSNCVDSNTDPGDCDSTPSGPNLVFNGDFASWYFNGWTGGGNKWQNPTGYTFFENYGTGSETIQQTLTLTTGETYILSFDIGTNSTYSVSSTFNAKVAGNMVYSRTSDQLFADNGGNSAYSGGNITNTSTITVTFVAPSNSVILEFEGTSTGEPHDNFFLDNISVRQGTPCDDEDNSSNEPPTLTATGNQIFCPGSSISIVETVNITDPDDTQLGAAFIQISSNYDTGDLLALTGSNPGITATWNALEGKLTLTGPANLTAFENAIKNVRFSSTATLDRDTKNFSIVLAEANYLQNTQHYYEYIPAVGITWTDARDAAAARTFYGLQGYLATITTADEAQLLGTQASGAGWIGASDAGTEGQWRWVTGPEGQEASGQGRLFWTGMANGTAIDYANWNNGEPNNSGDEDYAHINAPGTGFDGSWNDLSNVGSGSGEYQPKGYLVEYGGISGDPVLPTITAVTSLAPFVIDASDQPVDQTVFSGNQALFGVTVNNADSYQWQVSTDSGVNFVNIHNGSDYSGTNTANLTVLKTNVDKNDYRFRLVAHNNTSDCDAISNAALLKIKIGTVISNRRITYRVKNN